MTKTLSQLNDEQILKEFVKRFQCDGAILIYLDGKTEIGFGNWRNTLGRKWIKHVFEHLDKKVVDKTYLDKVDQKR